MFSNNITEIVLKPSMDWVSFYPQHTYKNLARKEKILTFWSIVTDTGCHFTLDKDLMRLGAQSKMARADYQDHILNLQRL